jgi:hypothetical protein
VLCALGETVLASDCGRYDFRSKWLRYRKVFARRALRPRLPPFCVLLLQCDQSQIPLRLAAYGLFAGSSQRYPRIRSKCCRYAPPALYLLLDHPSLGTCVAHADAQSRHHRVSHVYAALGGGHTLPKKCIDKFLLHRSPRKIGSAGCTEARLALDVLGTFWTIAEVNNLFKLLK